MRLDDREREHDQGNEISGPEEWVTGWPAIVTSVQRSFVAMGAVRAVRALAVINQPSGFDCPGCAWPEAPPGARHRVEFCESGAKAVAEDATAARIDAAFFARHSVDDLRTRSDYWLGQAGRLTIPMIKRPGTTHYTPISWGDAFAEIARQLSGLADPNEAVFYTSGRTGNEAAFMYSSWFDASEQTTFRTVRTCATSRPALRSGNRSASERARFGSTTLPKRM